MNDLERLIAIEEIKQLKARYFRHMDMKEWEPLAMTFAPDAYYDATDAVRNGSGDDTLDQKFGSEWINRGREAIIDFIRGAVESMVTVHHGHMPEIEVLSQDEARGVWPMNDIVRQYDEGKLVFSLDGEGHYWETYVRIDGQWMIKTSRLSRLRVDMWRAE